MQKIIYHKQTLNESMDPDLEIPNRILGSQFEAYDGKRRRLVRVERPYHVERLDHVERPDRVERLDNVKRPDHVERPVRVTA